jgi:DNA-binding winged helix-turn-helix (wHTH) protein
MQAPINQLYKFGQFCLDVSERVLRRDGRVAPLSPKLFDTLLVLIENRGRILGKDELMQAIWPDTFVEESNLTHNISQIRRALGDGEYIETIPRRGYRFVSETQTVRHEAQDAEAVETGDGVGNNVFISPDMNISAHSVIAASADEQSELADSVATDGDILRRIEAGAGTRRSVEAGATGDAQGRESAASLLLGEFHPIRRVGEPGGQAMT